ncbi:MAG TPA: class I SAM-dependent methyltransferase [Planctomycetota bacterium]|nr:class I SAM-dependent methyltransferase [Planctomycetota bacterium]
MTQASVNVPSFASFYDFYDGAEFRQDQLRMYSDLAAEIGTPILELACGTGIIAIELARKGIRVTGLDIDPDMLDAARRKLAGEDAQVRERVDLVEADMKEFDLGRTFHGIFIPTNSWGYLTKTADHRSCLQSVLRHLDDGGVLAIEENYYSPDDLARMAQRRSIPTIQMARVNPATERFTTFHWTTTHVDFEQQVIHSRRFIEEVQGDGAVRRYVPPGGGAVRKHFFNRFELQLLLEQAGFQMNHLWGGYDRRPLGVHSRTMIFLAQKD